MQANGTANDARVELGMRLHQAGRLAEAEALYRLAVDHQPNNGQALQLLGVVACQREDFAKGAELIRQAIARGAASGEAYCNLGNALAKLGRLDEAVNSFRSACKVAPKMVQAHSSLAGVLGYLKRLDEAEAAWRTVLGLSPQDALAHFHLGNLLYQLDNRRSAIESYQTAVKLQPTFADAYCNLGCALRDVGRFDESVVALCTAIDQMPGKAEAYTNLGVTLKDLGRLDEAETACRVGLSLIPESVVAQFNLACVLQDQSRLDEAEPLYKKAIERSPDYVEAHWNYALLLLRQGRFKEGWAEHEWRLKSRKSWAPRMDFGRPVWRGQPLDGKTILVHCEQGLGDAMQFIRYAPLVAARGGRVVVLTYPPLARLLRTVPGVAEVVTDRESLPAFDCHVPILSLPFVFGTELDTIPIDIPYLRPDPEAAAAWTQRLAGAEGLKVGLAWSGDPRPNDPDANRLDRRRSIPLVLFGCLAGIPGMTLFSLQKGVPAQQLKDPPPGLIVQDFMDEIGDFADTAALVDALDLVITVDTSVAHLAGALGKPTWILSRFDGCWRWLENRDDSPWYPKACLFRQMKPDSWPEVLERVKEELERFATSGGGLPATPATEPNSLLGLSLLQPSLSNR